MTNYTIKQGETGIFDITVLDEAGAALDVSTSATTNIIVTFENKGTIFAKYSLVDMGVTFGTLTTATNVITILTNREESKEWETGIAKANVTIEQDDATLTHKVYEFTVDNYLTIETGSNKDITLLHA